jgi:hypothetical protein
MGFILHKNKDYIMLNNMGLFVLGLCNMKEKRIVKDNTGE